MSISLYEITLNLNQIPDDDWEVIYFSRKKNPFKMKYIPISDLQDWIKSKNCKRKVALKYFLSIFSKDLEYYENAQIWIYINTSIKCIYKFDIYELLAVFTYDVEDLLIVTVSFQIFILIFNLYYKQIIINIK